MAEAHGGRWRVVRNEITEEGRGWITSMVVRSLDFILTRQEVIGGFQQGAERHDLIYTF